MFNTICVAYLIDPVHFDLTIFDPAQVKIKFFVFLAALINLSVKYMYSRDLDSTEISGSIPMNDETQNKRYFTSYSGLSLPLNLVGEIFTDDMENRNTFFEATYDDQGRLISCSKLVYGEAEMVHHYSYREDGTLESATISSEGEEMQTLFFDPSGKRVHQ